MWHGAKEGTDTGEEKVSKLLHTSTSTWNFSEFFSTICFLHFETHSFLFFGAQRAVGLLAVALKPIVALWPFLPLTP